MRKERPLGLQIFKHIICRAAELQMALVRLLLSDYVAYDWFSINGLQWVSHSMYLGVNLLHFEPVFSTPYIPWAS